MREEISRFQGTGTGHQPQDRGLLLYAIDHDGKRLERLTFVGGFSAFPVFSPDGRKLVFASNRNARQPHEINIFIADWVP